MFTNYLKIAFRNILKNKVYSLLNIFGLALGLAACFFIFQYIHFEKSFDRFNKKASDIYRVTLKFSGSFSDEPLTVANHPAVGPSMKAEFPEVVDFARVVNITLFGNSRTFTYHKPDGTVKSYNEEDVYVT